MNIIKSVICVGVCVSGMFLGTYLAVAQQEGFLEADDVAPPSSENMLPPGAVVQGAYVQHTINSDQENLHLLASFYYGNAREWRRIYNENRTVIKNPNRLPVGEVLRIHVGENWQPKVDYTTWLSLAVRNGQWQPDVPWQRANKIPVPDSPPPSTSSSLPLETPTPTPRPESQATIPAEPPPAEHPAEMPTQESATVEEVEMTGAEPTASSEEPDPAETEQPSSEEEVPAEPAF